MSRPCEYQVFSYRTSWFKSKLHSPRNTFSMICGSSQDSILVVTTPTRICQLNKRTKITVLYCVDYFLATVQYEFQLASEFSSRIELLWTKHLIQAIYDKTRKWTVRCPSSSEFYPLVTATRSCSNQHSTNNLSFPIICPIPSLTILPLAFPYTFSPY